MQRILSVIFSSIVLGSVAGAQVPDILGPDCEGTVFFGPPATQGSVVYDGPSCPDFSWFCNLGTPQPAGEIGEEIHMIATGQLASFTFGYFMAAGSPPAQAGDSVKATVSFYPNDGADSIPPGAPLATFVIQGLPYVPGTYYVHTEDVVGGPIFSSQHLWVGVTIEGPLGSYGAFAGAGKVGNNPPQVGVSHNLTWWGPSACVGDPGLIIDNATFGLSGNYILTVRVVAPVACEFAVPNGDFEDGTLANWSAVGRAGAESVAFGISPPSGLWQAVVTNGSKGGLGTAVSAATLETSLGLTGGKLDAFRPGGNPAREGSAIWQTLMVNAGDELRFRWNFLTDDPAAAGFNDFAFLAITPGDVYLLADTFSTGGTSPSSYAQETGYGPPYSFVFPAPGTYTVGFGVADAGDGAFDSALAIDCVELVPGTPGNTPPTCEADFTLARMSFDEVSLGSFVVTEGNTIVVPFTGVDADGDSLMASAGNLPAEATFDPTSGVSPLTSTLSWTPQAADKGLPRTVTATFTDPSGATSTCEVTIADVNLNPVCTASDQTVSSTGPEGALVTLDGGATDGDDPSLEFTWFVSDASVVLDNPYSPTANGVFPIGVTMATLCVVDGRGGVSTCHVKITVVDTAPVQVSCHPSVTALWPPKHWMVEVTLTVAIDGDPTGFQLDEVRVRSDEPDDAIGNGDGNTTGDVEGHDGYSTVPFGGVDVTPRFAFDAASGEWSAVVLLRAERAGGGDGRQYTFDVRVLDASGNPAETSCVVVVPHDRRGMSQ